MHQMANMAAFTKVVGICFSVAAREMQVSPGARHSADPRADKLDTGFLTRQNIVLDARSSDQCHAYLGSWPVAADLASAVRSVSEQDRTTCARCETFRS